MSELDQELLSELAGLVEEAGLLRLGAARLDHAGFVPARAALDRFLDAGWHGDMEFLVRSREARHDPATMLPGARTVLVAVAPHGGEAGPVARYAQHRDYHTVLHERLAILERALHERIEGIETLVCVDTRPVMERAAAVLAGLGFLGKHGGLIVPGLGSYVLIGVVLCTAPWSGPDAAVDLAKVRWDACGDCTRCLDACPTDAFPSPGVLDPRRCISYLTIEHRGPVSGELAARMGERVAGCDVCQEVCPYNSSEAGAARVPAAAWVDPLPDREPMDLASVANCGSAAYRKLVRDTPLRRIPRRHLRRNALLAIGNRGGPPGPKESAALERAAEDPEPLVRDAAAWALARRTGDE